MRFNIVAKRLLVLLPLALIFFRILLLFALFVFGFRNAGMDSRPVLVIIGGKKLGDIDDIIRGKFLDESDSGQVHLVVLGHPDLQLGRYSQLRDEVIEIGERLGSFGFFAYIGEAPRQQIKRHFAHGFRLASLSPHVSRELYGSIAGGLRTAGRAGNRHQSAKHAPKNQYVWSSHAPDASRSSWELRQLRAGGVA